MPFDRKKVRIERFSTEVTYHSAYHYLSLKGVLAERWAHGPVFGAFAEQGYQITLSPPAEKPQTLQGVFGIKQSGLNQEQINDVDEARRLAVDWLSDVYSVLEPRRTVGINVTWFALYPLRNPEQASKRLRDRYYVQDEVAKLNPSRYGSYHSAVETFIVHKDETFTLVIGVVGPRHEGQFFTTADPDRDKQWWMGVRLLLQLRREGGIDEPIDALKHAVEETWADLGRAVTTAFPTIVD